MLELEEAWLRIEQHRRKIGWYDDRHELVKLEHASGRVVYNELTCQESSPRFDKSLVDGFAIAETNISGEYDVVGVVTAGQNYDNRLLPDQAIRIMTGAPVPLGTAGVVMLEEVESLDGDQRIKFNVGDFCLGQNVLRKGAVVKSGESLVSRFQRLKPHQVGALAEFGISQIDVWGGIDVAVLTTGDEIVPHWETPGVSQIRNSNGPMIAELAKAAGAQVTDLGIGRDSETELINKIQAGLKSDVLVISGAVSAGDLDLIPKSLSACGVDNVFHKINLKPGKPLWFGVHKDNCLVFGLPGNPVSALVCFHLFVEPLIRFQKNLFPNFRTAELTDEFYFAGGRRTFWPCRRFCENGKVLLQPLGWRGSSDQVTYLTANAWLHFNGKARRFKEGELATYLSFSGDELS